MCFSVILTLFTFVVSSIGDYPFRNPSLPWDQRVEDVVGRLTIEEIQTQLASGQDAAPAIRRLGIGEYVWWSNCERGDVTQNASAFPQAIGLGASFDSDLLYRVAEASSIEVRAYYNYFIKTHAPLDTHKGLSCFSPNMDLYRDPRWGRGPETFSEDPYHSGELGYQHVKGLHGYHPRYVRTSSGCKHFSVSGGPEDWPISRQKFDAHVTERDYRTYFLPSFRRCVEAGAYSLICAYNSINGVPACANKELLTDILRDEWKFTGYIAADAGEILNIITVHKYLNNSVDTAAACLKAGCNLEVQKGDKRVYNSIIDAIHQGKLTEEFVRDQIKPLFYTRLRLGEFDPPAMNPYNLLDKDVVVLSEQHQYLAIEAAVKSFVLLKNDDFLPLFDPFETIAIVGPMSNNSGQMFGDYSPNTDPQFVTTPVQGLRRLGNTMKHADGCTNTTCTDYRKEVVIQAIDGADAIFVCLGTGPAIEREGHDRHTIDLPGSQMQMLQDIADNTDKKIVLLLFNGGPVNIEWAYESPKVTVILECFLPAQATGIAVFDALSNANNGPGGRLPYTWPLSDAQIPAMVNYSMAGRTYRHFTGTPAFPFGYGLSYTTFSYNNLVCTPQIVAGMALNCSVTVKNTGPYGGDEVTQVYIQWQSASLPVPNIQLVGFNRSFIGTGQSKTYSFSVEPQNMAIWTDGKGWVVYPGKMNIFAGGQQPNQKRKVPSNVLKGQFEISNQRILGRF